MPDTNEVLQQGRYRIVNRLVQNGTGSLYEAYDNVQATNVVLKEIPIKLNKVTTPAQLESLKLAFAGEADLLAEINHDSFIQVQNHFSEIDAHYLVLDLVAGDYLGDLLEKDQRAFSLLEITAWADQLLDALNYLHGQSPAIVHRDVRPQNIKLPPDGRVKLLALSVAKNADQRAGAAIANPGFDASTLHYLPLEQIWGKLDLASQKVIANSYSEGSVDVLMQPPDARSDIYALGATLYHLITARRPVDALERSIDILEGKADPLPIPSKLNPNVPPEISYVVMKAMELKRENRFDSAIMMRQVLRTAAVRVREREAKEGKKSVEAPTHAMSLSQPTQPVPEHSVKQSSVETEADLNRQMEAIKIRLREAEAQKLEAEERAAEAEKRLREKETHDVVAYALIADDVAPALEVLDIPNILPDRSSLKEVKDNVQMLDIPKTRPQEVKPPAIALVKEAPVNDFAFSYNSDGDQPKDKKMLWRALAVAACLAVFVGAGFGIWSFSVSNAGSNQPLQTPAMSLTDSARPEASLDPAPAQVTENAPETIPSAIGASPETPETSENSPEAAAPGSRPVSQSPAQIAQKEKDKAKKQPVQTAKAAPSQKKAVTVDDLINDH